MAINLGTAKTCPRVAQTPIPARPPNLNGISEKKPASTLAKDWKEGGAHNYTREACLGAYGSGRGSIVSLVITLPGSASVSHGDPYLISPPFRP